MTRLINLAQIGCFVLFSLAIISGCATSPAPAPLTDTSATDMVVKSPNDQRDYAHVTLDNGMRVLLISDPDADKSAAALVAFRGSFHDPEDRPGLAHFLEHMLFIGTEKYPEPDGYFAFVQKHGGGSNAYTAPDHTNYFFDIQPEYFVEGLDRFAQFFISPLLDKTYVDREKNAVHSEYQMQIKEDGWRGFMVQKVAMNPEHPMSKFNIGTLDTLDGDAYSALITFFEGHYSANQMGAVILHNEPIATLKPWVTELLGQVPNRDLPNLDLTTPLTAPGQLPATLRHQTLKSDRSVSFSFPIPAIDPYYQTKPTGYIGSLIGHEGQGSLHQLLTQKGWITGLGAGSENIDQANAIFNISVQLTEAGMDQVPAITDLVFDYINLLRTEKAQAWLYREAATVATLGFRFREQIPSIAAVQSLAPNLMKFPAKDLLVAPYLLENFDAELIDNYLSYLRPDNVLVTVAGPEVEGDKTEQWFDVAYALDSGIERRDAESGALTLPAPNPFLPEDLTLIESADNAPEALPSTGPMAFYLAADTEFGVPRAMLHVSLRRPDGLISVADSVRARLYRNLVEDDLNALSYPALLAGVSYGISTPDRGFRISLGGYQDKQSELLQVVLDRLTSLTINPDRFLVLKTELENSLQDSFKNRPFQQGFDRLRQNILSSSWPAADQLAELATVTPEDLSLWRDAYFEQVGVEALAVGNLDMAAAQRIQAQLANSLVITPTAAAAPTVTQIDGPITEVMDIDHNDASLVLYLQNNDDALLETAKSNLLGHIIAPEYFSSLRTEQQLGYVVSAFSPEFEQQGGLGFVIQSPSAPADALHQKTLEFLAGEVIRLADMSPEDYAQNQEGLIAQVLEKDKNLGERAWRYWSDLDEGYQNFDGNQQLADAISSIDHESLKAYLDDMLKKAKNQYLLILSEGRFKEPATTSDEAS